MSRIAASILCLWAASVAAAIDERASSFVLCKNQSNVRSIRVVTGKAGTDCVTMYTKAGVDKMVGGNRSVTGCNSVLKSIRSNLEAANWNCRTVQEAHVLLGDEIFR